MMSQPCWETETGQKYLPTEPGFPVWLIGKDPDAGRDWGQEEKGMMEDEMAGWHHQLDGHEFEWTPGVGDGQGGLVCCDAWGRKEWTRLSDWTELNWIEGWIKLGKFTWCKTPSGLPRWLSSNESVCQCRRYEFNPWVKKMPWRRKWQPILVFLPGISHGQRSLMGYSPWSRRESHMIKWLTLSLFTWLKKN